MEQEEGFQMKDYYRIRMSNGDTFCTDANPLGLTGDWAVIPGYWVGITGT